MIRTQHLYHYDTAAAFLSTLHIIKNYRKIPKYLDTRNIAKKKLGSKYDLLDTPCIMKYKQIY